MADDRIGVVGLGVMGSHMARHLYAAGKELMVLDLNPVAVERFKAEHPDTRSSTSLAEVAGFADIVLTMLPSGKELRQAALGEGGLIEGFRPGSLLLDTSSVAPWHSREVAGGLQERGVGMVDAPVSGAEMGARDATLVFMAGGSPADVARARPLFEILGSRSFHLGPLGAGEVMKAMNNLITAVVQTATTEAMLVGTRAGLDPAVMNDVLDVSTGGSWVSRMHFRQRVFNRAFDDTFTLDLMLKDMKIAGEIADELSVAMPVSDEARRLWIDVQNDLPANSPISGLARVLEQRTGIELTSAAGRHPQVEPVIGAGS